MDDKIFKETIKGLLDIAEMDGVITSEEMEILEQVRIDADSYSVNLAEAKSDGIITGEEAIKLERLKKMIIDRAEIVANIDGNLSKDEKDLLTTLKYFLDQKYVLDK